LSINADTAKKLAAAAIAESRKNGWSMAVAVTDTSGELVYFEKMDATQLGSVDVRSTRRARPRASSGRPGLSDALAAGGDGLRILRLRGATPVEGGLPLVADGKIIGASVARAVPRSRTALPARRAPMR